MSLPKKMPRGRKSKSQDEGRVFANRYRVEKRLGSGSFGTVYLVEDVKTKGEWKVLKEIFVGELPADETVDAMREARLLSNLNHPNIVKFMDSFIDGELFCIVTEYCEGGDLDDKIKAWKKAGRTFDESLILAWFIQLAMAIQFMHDKRILHRDLKTRNIFLKNNIVKLGDFGISRILMGTSDMATTFTGTPYYMSPEVLKHEGYKYKSDIWSMGVVLYELCNLEHAFHGESLMGVMYKIVEGNPPSLSDQYSKELKDLYKRMLDKNPVNRPTASEVIRTQYIAKHLTKLKLQMHERLSSSLGSQQQRSKQYDEPERRPLTPMERVKLKKLQKADEEAEKIKRFMATQAQENQAKYSSHKKSQHRVSLPWVEEHPDVFNDAAFTVNPTDSLPYTPRHVSSLPGAVESSGNRNKESSIHSAAEASLSLTNVSEIPEDADLAETFYSQFDYEFENDESDNDDNFVAGAQDDISDEEGYDEEDELSALMGHMQDALDQSLLGDRTVPEPACENFTDSLRDQRIKGLRAECVKLLGREAFARAYSYLKQVRFVDERRDEDSIMDGLAKIVAKPRDCFLVDQLLFMEKQAEIAAMT